MKPGVEAHYLGARDQEDHSLNQFGQKVSKTPSQPISLAWWRVPGIPAMQEDLGLRLAPVDNMRPYLKNKAKKNGLGV
jgi:hypothetical protein